MDYAITPPPGLDDASMAAMRRPVILCLSRGGLRVAETLAKAVNGDVHGLASRCLDAPFHFEDTIAHIAGLFVAGRPLIGLCAAAILIRAVAPHLGQKQHDAPVLAIADDGSSIVPLLGLHNGALDLGARLAAASGGHLAVTTASNLGDGVSLDTPPAGFRLANKKDAAAAMAGLLAGGGAAIDFDEHHPIMIDWLAPVKRGDDMRLTITHDHVDPSANQLVFCPRQFILGIGCARGCDSDELYDFVTAELRRQNVNQAAIAAIASVDLKADEPAILALAARLDVPFRVFSVAELERQTGNLANPSDVVFVEIGLYGVAEAAALEAAMLQTGGAKASLFIEKQKTKDATLALVKMAAPLVDQRLLRGRKPGKVMLIGIGPGKSDWRTPEAAKWIQSADELVGYGLYIDLLGAAAAHLPRKDFALGEEESRCRYALETAATGRNVAIICSGDAGIYAMGALVFELLDRDADDGGVSAAAHRVEVISAPGVSALQAGAARSGAILGHDFCAISLSDLLTPWASIETRIHAAGAGDFVIAFYNPVSQRRRTQLATARDILISYRGGDVPVLLASNLGRPEEQIKFRTLGSLAVDEVDMLTVIMVGSSTSKMLDLGRGKAVYTPRGYAKRIDKIKQ